MKCPIVSFEVSVGLAWLWEACLLMLSVVFLLCWKIAWYGNWTEMAMATHSSTLARKVPWMEEPGRLQSMGSLGVGHDFTFIFHFDA